MYAITIYPEWAKAIIDGHKNIENRTWKPIKNYRGTLYIHSAKREPNPTNLKIIEDICGVKYKPHQLIQGAIIGSVQLTKVEEHLESENKWAIPNNYHWVLSNPQPFDQPVKIAGKQKMWTYLHTALDRVLMTKFKVNSNFRYLAECYQNYSKDIDEELIHLAVKYDLYLGEVKAVFFELINENNLTANYENQNL